MAKNTDVLVKQLYPKVANSLDRGLNRYKSCISRFIGNRNKELFDIAPCDRIYFGQTDLDDFYISLPKQILKKFLRELTITISQHLTLVRLKMNLL